MQLTDIAIKKYFFWFSILLIVLFTFLGAAKTGALPFPIRLFHWTLHIGLLVPLLITIHLALQSSFIFDRINDWIKLLISGLLASLAFLPFALGIDYLLGLDDWSQATHPEAIRKILTEEALGMFPPVLLVWTAMNAPQLLKLNFSRSLPSTVDESKAPDFNGTSSGVEIESSGKFIDKFSGQIGIDVVYLMAELHYVRVVTPNSDALILHNLKDAIEEIGAILPGIQTHRSFWVAARYIDSIKERNGQTFLMLKTGNQVPVSRRRLAEVKAFVIENPLLP